MMPSRRDRLDQLLARGRLPGSARERVLEAALREANVTRPWYARRLFVLTASPALAGAALAAVVLTVRAPASDMRSKGALAGGPRVTLECTRGDPGVCSREGMLLFRVEGARERAYVAAYAEPRGGGERIWFFPSGPDGREPVVEPSVDPQVMRQGVKVGSIPEGSYDVRVVMGTRPVSRDEALAAPAPGGGGGGGGGLTVEHLALTVTAFGEDKPEAGR
jgi:hypothetical protein